MFTDFCARYYEKNKENIQRKPCGRYQNLTEEEKNKNQEYGHKLYKNILGTEKESLAEYRQKKGKKTAKKNCYKQKLTDIS